ncbi:MAG: 2-hydroxychromene-2-carboxylate isomerase [Gammaproteobacteria bacterium]|nr:2-hydroxychromene-2-carboxylate isomerase [Gammaproteobacteria bacterium]
MPQPIEFYFDFSSPYGYLGAYEIDALAERHGRDVAWRPYLMGAVMKLTGRKPLVDSEIVARYTGNDLSRTARRIGVPFALPDPFPVATIAACRAYYWVLEQDPGKAKALAKALYAAYFVDGRNIGDAEVVLDVAEAEGIDRKALSDALQDPSVKEKLKQVTDDAAARGIFGSPFVIVDGEMFWGHDRFGQVDRWLESGGW